MKMPPKNRDWTPREVKAALQLAGTPISDLAQTHSYHTRAFSVVLERPMPHLEQLIADAIGIKPRRIWPSRYDGQGRTLRPDIKGRGGRSQNTTTADPCNIYAREVA
ncbi:MAG: helix-turn-helix domain-containing protein [Magnetococcales bacterium]|nr:helix-turn-helix domain-containing protein [Magnetococcales bacterium]